MAADIRKLFNVDLKALLAKNPDTARKIGGVYQLEVTGVGNWALDLAHDPPTIAEGLASSPGVTLSISEPDFQTLYADPKGQAMKLFFSGRLRVKGNQLMAMNLQKVLALLH